MILAGAVVSIHIHCVASGLPGKPIEDHDLVEPVPKAVVET